MTAYLCLGANIGDPVAQIEAALTMLDDPPRITVQRRSSLIRTAPYGKTDQPAFWNLVAQIGTELEPADLLAALQSIEQRLGRIRQEHWGPRTIDIDILLYGDQVIDSAQLRVPHPDFHNRGFALALMNELDPDLEHPVLHKTMSVLLKELTDREEK